MKFFYPLRWEGDGPATVIRIPAEDAAPVEAGAPLFVLRT
jgi:biotin carboxyl carrier protein